MEFLENLQHRNALLFWFGALNLFASLVLLLLIWGKPVEYGGISAWIKPLKFALATCILSWTVAWYCGYLPGSRDLQITSWILVISLGFEVIYIAWKAGQGEASHYNISTPFHSFLYTLMALGATLAVGYVGAKFFTGNIPSLPHHYLTAIRIGMVLFVIFSFQGFVMGSRLSHTVGGPDGGAGLPFLNWSRTLGDLRVAHFVGMHALQVLPLLAWYVLKNTKLVIVFGLLYGLLAVWVLLMALHQKPLIRY